MSVVYVVAGSACLVVAGVVVLLRLGFPRRAFAPTAAALIGVLLVVLGMVTWHARGGATTVAERLHPSGPPPNAGSPSATEPSPAPTRTTGVAPAFTGPPDDGSCSFTPGNVYASPPATIGLNAGLPPSGPGDVQRLPSELDPGRPAGATLVRSSAYPFRNPGYDVQTAIAIEPVMTDLNSADFDDLSLVGTGGIPFMQLAVGTPKPGTCWTQLASTALTSFMGHGHVFNPGELRPGRRMAAYHLRLVCADMKDGPDSCAWAGPGEDGRHPLFGILRVSPGRTVTGRGLTGAIMAAFTEKVFEALTAPPRGG